MTAKDVKFSEAMSSIPRHWRRFSCSMRSWISGSTTSRGVFPHDDTEPQFTTGERERFSSGFLSSSILRMAWNGKQIVSIASRVYFVLILFQIPLFRIQCRSGMCTTPVEMTASQLIASDIFPPVVVKALLYPGAIAKGLILERKIPSWNSIIDIYNLTDVKTASPVVELQRLEVLAGSYFSVAGALIGVIKPGRMSLFGTLLIVWGLVKEGIIGKPGNITEPEKALYVYPTILIALVCAFASIKYDIQKAIRGGQARPIAKPLQSSSKSKLQ